MGMAAVGRGFLSDRGPALHGGDLGRGQSEGVRMAARRRRLDQSGPGFDFGLRYRDRMGVGLDAR